MAKTERKYKRKNYIKLLAAYLCDFTKNEVLESNDFINKIGILNEMPNITESRRMIVEHAIEIEKRLSAFISHIQNVKEPELREKEVELSSI